MKDPVWEAHVRYEAARQADEVAWRRFVKLWQKLGNAYANRNSPPLGMPGCEGFVLPDHAKLVPRAVEIVPVPVVLVPSGPVDVVAVYRSCGTKSRYSTEEIANAVAIRCWQDRGADLRAYSCELCGGGWHLTKRGAQPRMREGWREPKISERQQNILEKSHKPRRRER